MNLIVVVGFILRRSAWRELDLGQQNNRWWMGGRHNLA
jgi:hypothetical protein